MSTTTNVSGGSDLSSGDEIRVPHQHCRSSNLDKVGDLPVAGDVETTLGRIWKEVLAVDEIGGHDDFFELGGDSLGIIMVLSAIDEQMHVAVDLGDMFDVTTLSGQAQLIEAAARSAREDRT